MDLQSHVVSGALEPEQTDESRATDGLHTGLSTVFLHAGWRCGSTYIWSRFRRSPSTMCFYEPFHETLDRCTTKKVRRDTYSSWNSRHPPLDHPYREEYLSLIRLRGIRGYRDDFALARYFPSEAGIAPEVRYLRRLLEHAHRAGKRAIFGFSRSLARSGAIKHALGGYHIVVQRNPLQQWLSCRSYRIADASVYFELCHFLILALAPTDSPAGRFARQLGLPQLRPGRFREQYECLRRALWPWSDELSYQAFLGVHAISHRIAKTTADLTIDIDRLDHASTYRDAIRDSVRASTGLIITFPECRLGSHDRNQVSFDADTVESEVLQMLHRCGMTCNPYATR